MMDNPITLEEERKVWTIKESVKGYTLSLIIGLLTIIIDRPKNHNMKCQNVSKLRRKILIIRTGNSIELLKAGNFTIMH